MTVFDTITNIVSEFSPDPLERQGPPLVEPLLRMRDPFSGFFIELRWNQDNHLQTQIPTVDEGQLRRSRLECQHYMSNVCVLLWFFHDYLERCRNLSSQSKTDENDPQARLLDVQSYLLPINVDKLLGDVRSFLDSIYRLTLVFTPPEVVKAIPNKAQESFGRWADRKEAGTLTKFEPPLALLEELIPWGQTVRKMRDDYIHRGKDSIAMPRFGPQHDQAQVYFDLHGFSKRPNNRSLPDALYATDNPNDLLDLELLVLYISLPSFALQHALGRWLREHHSQTLSEWKPMGDSCSSGGGGISALGAMLMRRPEVLDLDLYRFRVPTFKREAESSDAPSSA